ncbi:hypothetical protein BDV25DRAFT_135959 [Aspergillus avenaceus]|uniref:Uncharacterized protein n=1 Tax=Aspergillus avenaceus TaxID=36643 RepID=A0A5N6U788_ASPAV|nr:hypothetical protein BDV25DRAFT_135959 [Aspergillus avenaceus]
MTAHPNSFDRRYWMRGEDPPPIVNDIPRRLPNFYEMRNGETQLKIHLSLTYLLAHAMLKFCQHYPSYSVNVYDKAISYRDEAQMREWLNNGIGIPGRATFAMAFRHDGFNTQLALFTEPIIQEDRTVEWHYWVGALIKGRDHGKCLVIYDTDRKPVRPDVIVRESWLSSMQVELIQHINGPGKVIEELWINRERYSKKNEWPYDECFEWIRYIVSLGGPSLSRISGLDPQLAGCEMRSLPIL